LKGFDRDRFQGSRLKRPLFPLDIFGFQIAEVIAMKKPEGFLSSWPDDQSELTIFDRDEWGRLIIFERDRLIGLVLLRVGWTGYV
jgi:hypothetical protein